jgi:hypothetical protein
MFDTNNKVVDYLYRSLCESEFERVRTEDLACRIWEQLKNAHAGNARFRLGSLQPILPSESIDAMFQRFTVIVNNMRANVAVLPYDDHDRAVVVRTSLGPLPRWVPGPTTRWAPWSTRFVLHNT